MKDKNSNIKLRRMFDTYLLIKQGSIVIKKDLAKELNVSEDTIKNYVSNLRCYFKVGIHNENGKYVIDDPGDFEGMKQNYPLNEYDVVLIISTLIQSDAFMETKMAIIRDNLLNMLPEYKRKKLKSMFVMDKKENKDDRDIQKTITKIQEAITDGKKMNFIYKKKKGSFDNFTMIPYNIACDFGKYSIIGKRDEREILYNLRIDRISNLIVSDKPGRRPKDFNLYDYLKKTWYMWNGQETRVVVRFEEGCRQVVTERNMSVGRIIREDDKYFDYEFICNGIDGIKIWLMGFGGEAEVLEPKSLRNKMKAAAEKMIEVYSK